jgi:hypothetical protein
MIGVVEQHQDFGPPIMAVMSPRFVCFYLFLSTLGKTYHRKPVLAVEMTENSTLLE